MEATRIHLPGEVPSKSVRLTEEELEALRRDEFRIEVVGTDGQYHGQVIRFIPKLVEEIASRPPVPRDPNDPGLSYEEVRANLRKIEQQQARAGA